MARDKNETVTIVEDVSFSIGEKEILSIVGESGCGKSMTALGLIGLLKKNQYISEGAILFKDKNFTDMTASDIRKICGKDIGIIFQEPMMSLNPFFKIGKQIEEPLVQHLKMSKKEARKRSVELLEEVGIHDASKVAKSYSHELSGGMKQRVLIAIAISCNPSLIIADEPTTALDVIIQAQILDLLKKLIFEREMSLLLISHDFGVISQMADKVAVMYAGEIIEIGTIDKIMSYPKHPYTKALLQAANEINTNCSRLSIIEGNVPRPGDLINGCKFANRCYKKENKCMKEKPHWYYHDGLKTKCWYA
ncbi:ABC transporter ATP-binding protein [Helicovermis profundi]